MNLPKPKLILPRDLRKEKNGELDPSLLRKVESNFILHHKAAAAWEVLAGLAAQEHIRLGQVGDYRTYASQLALFLDRMRDYPDAKREKQTTRKFRGKTWYLHNGAPVAVPGTSNHGWALAVDACVIVKRRGKDVKQSITTKPARAKRSGLNFLLTNAVSLGWGWELDSEQWHVRYYAGDAGTPRLNEFLG